MPVFVATVVQGSAVAAAETWTFAPTDAYVLRNAGAGAGIDAAGRPRGIVAQLSRAIVVGPIARLELIPSDDHKPADNSNPEMLIEAQIPAQQFREMGFKEGETLVVTPRRARVFLDHAANI